VRTAIDRLAERLAKVGVKLARSSDLLPDLADLPQSNVMRLLVFSSFASASTLPSLGTTLGSSMATAGPTEAAAEIFCSATSPGITTTATPR
jgi:hypothetical protein